MAILKFIRFHFLNADNPPVLCNREPIGIRARIPSAQNRYPGDLTDN